MGTPAVVALATQLGVPLAQVAGTGAGGRITPGDVRLAAGLPRDPAAYMAPSSVTARVRPTLIRQVLSQFDGVGELARARNAQVDVDAYAVNPLLDDLKQSDPTSYASAIGRGQAPPTLFESGDVPIFVACGYDSAELLRLPWAARQPAATTADQAEAARIFELCGSTDLESAVANAGMLGSGHPGNAAYMSRMVAWATGGAHVIQMIR